MALPNTEILVGAPPLLWSNVHEAFEKINQNFQSLDAATGGAAVDFNTLYTNVSPATDNNYNIGSPTHKWAAVFASGYSNVPGDEYNGVWLGNAHLKGIDGKVDLPTGSTVNGELIVDPTRTGFKEIQVDYNTSIVASGFSDSFNLLSGSGIELLVNSSSDSIEINNSGIIDIINGGGLSVSTADGVSTISNAGVVSLSSVASLPTGRTPGAGINIDKSSGSDIKITNTGVLSITNGPGIDVLVNQATGEVRISNVSPAVNSFTSIQINGDTEDRLQADTTTDILTIESGAGISLAKNTVTDTITISVNPVFDIKGSVFGDDSTKIVDAVENKIYSTFYGNLTGNVTGNIIGNVTGNVLGNITGYHIGDTKGSVVGDDSTMLVDGVSGRLVGPVYTSILRTSEYDIKIGGESGTNWAPGSANVAVGFQAGYSQDGSQTGVETTAVGSFAGWNQKNKATALGSNAGTEAQGEETVAVGFNAGGYRQKDLATAVGGGAGYADQSTKAVAVGHQAGYISQGANAVALGTFAGYTSQSANSIVINASGVALNGSAAGLFIDPVRSTANGRPLMYDPTTKEISSSNVLEFVGSTISTSDSTGLTVDVLTTFMSDVFVENELTVAGSKVVKLSTLKSVVAASTSFADFQARIAALV